MSAIFRLIAASTVVVATAVSGYSSASAQTTRFTFATTNGARDFSSQAAVRWQQAMRDASNGAIRMEFLPGGSLGGDSQLLQQLANNEIQIHVAGPVVVHSLVPQYQCMEAEFVFEDEAHGFKVWTGDLGREVSRALEERNGVTIIGVASRGARHITSNTAIRNPDDLKGVKMRVTNNLRGQVFAAYGALPGPLSIAELYGALRQGVFDAQENPISTIYGNKFYEVQKYVNLTGHVWSYNILTANKRFVDGLPSAHREIFDRTLKDSLAWLNEQVHSEEKDLLDRMTKERGVEVIQPDVATFRRIAAPIVDRFGAEKCRPGLLKDIAALATR